MKNSWTWTKTEIFEAEHSSISNQPGNSLRILVTKNFVTIKWDVSIKVTRNKVT